MIILIWPWVPIWIVLASFTYIISHIIVFWSYMLNHISPWFPNILFKWMQVANLLEYDYANSFYQSVTNYSAICSTWWNELKRFLWFSMSGKMAILLKASHVFTRDNTVSPPGKSAFCDKRFMSKLDCVLVKCLFFNIPVKTLRQDISCWSGHCSLDSVLAWLIWISKEYLWIILLYFRGVQHVYDHFLLVITIKVILYFRIV